MILLNFAHPLTEDHLHQIEHHSTGKPIRVGRDSLPILRRGHRFLANFTRNSLPVALAATPLCYHGGGTRWAKASSLRLN